MKNTKFTKVMFALMPFLSLSTLSSCGSEYGKELKNEDSEEGQALLDSISAEMKNVKNFEMKIKEDFPYASLYGTAITNVKTEQLVLVNENKDMFTTYSGTWDEGKQETTSYMFSNGEGDTTCYGQTSLVNGDNSYSVTGFREDEGGDGFYNIFLSGLRFYDLFRDPSEFLAGLYGDYRFFNTSTTLYPMVTMRHLYSKGKGNLTIKIDKKVNMRSEADEKENIVSEMFVVTYDKYVFKSASVEQATDYGNKKSWDVSFEKKDYFTIDFPEAMKHRQS
ncbi:MAG: hypothetical protein J5627_04600 [Bacilli bacterium]|nr:hypothetical protein [Bacilli bacterium]